MKPITICFTYFKSLALANLAAALYSLSRQDLSQVEEIVIVDNDTADAESEIRLVIDALKFPVPVGLLSFKHGDGTKTHCWSTNTALGEARTPWVLFSRADYVLDFDLLRRFYEIVMGRPQGWDGFVTANVYHLAVDVGVCEQTRWRDVGPQALLVLPGVENSYTCIDAGVWMARRDTFNHVGRLDEALTAWGHAQTHFQHKLHATGTEFVRIPEPMFFHPQHAAPRDLALAHQQLRERGIDIKQLWQRYEGAQPY